MSIIPLPKKISYESKNPASAKLIIEPLYPGYGTTIGNLLRRVLLSSLNGTAINNVRIKGVEHEFSTIPHVKEDLVEIILNIKKIRIKANNEITEPLSLELKTSGEKKVTAGDIKAPSDITIVNPKQKIATITDSAGALEMELIVSMGRGYVQVERQDDTNKEVGLIAIDTLYSPIVKVAIDIKNVRVDKMTNYDSLTLDIETDGTRTPEEAVKKAIEIIQEQLDFIKGGGKVEEEDEKDTIIKKQDTNNNQ